MSTLEAAVSQDTLRTRIREFFYGKEVPYGLAIMRIVLTFTVLISMAYRWTSAARAVLQRRRAGAAVGSLPLAAPISGAVGRSWRSPSTACCS